MNAPRIWKLLPALFVCGVVGAAYAKLPAPPPADPAKAEEAKKKAAEAAKKAAEAQARAEDRVVARYRKEKGGAAPAAAAPAAAAKK